MLCYAADAIKKAYLSATDCFCLVEIERKKERKKEKEKCPSWLAAIVSSNTASTTNCVDLLFQVACFGESCLADGSSLHG